MTFCIRGLCKATIVTAPRSSTENEKFSRRLCCQLEKDVCPTQLNPFATFAYSFHDLVKRDLGVRSVPQSLFCSLLGMGL